MNVNRFFPTELPFDREYTRECIKRFCPSLKERSFVLQGKGLEYALHKVYTELGFQTIMTDEGMSGATNWYDMILQAHRLMYLDPKTRSPTADTYTITSAQHKFERQCNAELFIWPLYKFCGDHFKREFILTNKVALPTLHTGDGLFWWVSELQEASDASMERLADM